MSLQITRVEHALCVEYLYAHYSLNTFPFIPYTKDDYSINFPLDLSNVAPLIEKETKGKIFAAAREVFLIAVEEMHHLRWVNEALNLLGAPISLGRASYYKSLQKDFSLEPLTKERLQWFISVEKPSQI